MSLKQKKTTATADCSAGWAVAQMSWGRLARSASLGLEPNSRYPGVHGRRGDLTRQLNDADDTARGMLFDLLERGSQSELPRSIVDLFDTMPLFPYYRRGIGTPIADRSGQRAAAATM
jgi:hypothetical protein